MRNATTYLHSLARLRALDAINVEINSSDSLVEPALASALAHESRRAPRAALVEYTDEDRAWFRRPLRALAALLVAGSLALGASNASADVKTAIKRQDSAAIVKARRDVADAKARLASVRASERQIKARARDERRAAKLHAEIVAVETKLANEGK